ncbi:MAG: hypothetical protein GF341_09285 [candidate division Zixibacteria bacterium]|nr:hypothetical protein [candidate division Zixibacteria bacterium]
MSEHLDALDCQAALAKLYEYIDGELTETDRELVRQHLEMCRPCLTQYEYEELFHEYVKRRAPRPTASDSFKARLSQRLQDEANAMTFSGSSGRESRRQSFPRFALAASIMLLITVGAWWMTQNAGPRSCDWTKLAMIHEHSESVGSPLVTASTRSTIEAVRMIARELQLQSTFVPRSVPSELVTHEARVMPWKRHPIGQVGWRCPSSGNDVSFFISHESCMPMTDEPLSVIDGRSYRMATINGYRAICWREDAGYVCAIMAEQGFDTMIAWAEQMRDPRASF